MTSLAGGSEATLERALQALERGDATAEDLLREVLVEHIDEPTALASLGWLQLTQQRFGEALPLFDRLCKLEPVEASHWVNLAESYRGVGQLDEALAATTRAMELGADGPDVLYNLGLVHFARGDYEAARAVLKEALALAPHDTETRYRYVECCHQALQPDEALAALDGWTPPDDTPGELRARLGQVVMNLGDYPRAERWLRPVSALVDEEPRVALMLAQVYERTNRVDEADAVLRQLRADPRSSELGATLTRATARVAQRQSDHEHAVKLYRQTMGEFEPLHERHHILFSLAESLHALKRYDEVIATLVQAHQSQVEHIRRSRPMSAVRGTPQMIVTQYRCDPVDVATWIDAPGPSVDASPVFVVAYPRSGTTLLELTLDAHPRLQSMDEQPFVQNALEDIVAEGVTYPEELGRLDERQLDAIRARYWERVRRKVQLEPGQRIVDKNPLNILRLPVIRRLFPQAPILLAVRHPCDVILSCYMQHFRAPDFALLCADLPSLTQGYVRTFDFWYDQAALLRPKAMEVRYESFVSDFETVTRSIVDFIGLPWDAGVLEPARAAHAKKFISTPSYSQVVQPVNQKSVGRWQAYRRYLEPALPIVAPYLRRWNYAA